MAGRCASWASTPRTSTTAPATFLAAVGVHYPQVLDDRGDLLHRLGGTGLPVTLVLDAAGKVVYSHPGQLTEPALAKALAAAR